MDELKSILLQKGASEVGFADLKKTELYNTFGYPFGISIVLALNPITLKDIENGPTKIYHLEYERVNNLLDDLSIIGAKFLNDRGYKFKSFEAKTSHEGFIPDIKHTTYLPHKTLATLSGIGWIGKCALLVTQKYGSAIRLNSIFINKVYIFCTFFYYSIIKITHKYQNSKKREKKNGNKHKI